MTERSQNNVNYDTKGRLVDEAEKEASEVLHSLLSVERVEKPDNLHNIQHQVVVLSSSSSSREHDIQWHHSNVFMLESGNQNNTVVWDNTLALDVDTTTHTTDHMILPDLVPEETLQAAPSKRQPSRRGHVRKTGHKWQKKTPKSSKPADTVPETIAEESVDKDDDVNDVRQRFRMGCDCQEISCFQGLSPDSVYKHRLNIAELTKEEHDMYLMGVTMACMSDPGVTVKQRERRRLRAQYVYQGRRVCLSAFLYLENCTLYQLKRIRKHVITHGVTPRVHGNHGKKPHNVFSLDTYRRATDFLKGYIEQHNTNTGNCKNTVIFPPEVSRKTIHNAYQEYMKTNAPPEGKTMGYSTFRHFMKEQFPHVKFCKVELGTQNSNCSTNTTTKQIQLTCHNNIHRATNTEEAHTVVVHNQTAAAPVQAVTTIPVLIQEQGKPEVAGQTTYIVTPMSQLVQAAPYQPAHTITVTPITNYAFTTL